MTAIEFKAPPRRRPGRSQSASHRARESETGLPTCLRVSAADETTGVEPPAVDFDRQD